ncbi:MAG: FKBP-type peptidyl-prolyl cis-trans isomerase [Candidatus Methanofastidiosia archaeon]
MVSFKKKKKDNIKPKTKTKLKKRKLEKHRRRHEEKKFLHKHKKSLRTAALIVIILIMVAGAILLYQSSISKRSTVENGDDITFNFISYFDNGEVINHTIIPNPESVTVDTPLDDNRLKMPQRLTIGGYKNVQGILIPLYWNDNMLLGLKKGKTSIISIPAEWAYGGQALSPISEDERVFTVPIETEIDRFGEIDISSFKDAYGDPEIGIEVEIEGMNIRVIEIDESKVRYEYLVGIEDEIYSEYGKAIVVSIDEDTINARYVGEKDIVFYIYRNDTVLPAHIIDSSNEELTVEIDHYNFKIRIENIDKKVIDAKEWVISEGDFVDVRYIGYYEDGEVFDSSIADNVEVTKDTPLDNTNKHNELFVTVLPGNTLPGTQTLITGFNKALIGMKAGEEKIIEVPPTEGYGGWDQNKVMQIPVLVGEFDIIENVDKVQVLTLSDFRDIFEKDPVEGDTISFYYGKGIVKSIEEDLITVEVTSTKEGTFSMKYFNAEIIAQDESTLTLERKVEDGQKIPMPEEIWAIARIDDGKVFLEYDISSLEVGQNFSGGKITDITDAYIEVDKNHPMAGKTLYFKLRVMNFKKVSFNGY